MKNSFFLRLLLLSSMTVSLNAHAASPCLDNLDKHYRHESDMLILDFCQLQDTDMPAVMAFIEKNHITGLSAQNNQIGPDGIATFVKKNTTVDYLDLSNNPLGDMGARILAKDTVKPWALYLSSCQIGDSGVEALSNLPLAADVDISLANNPVSSTGAITLASDQPSQGYAALDLSHTLVDDIAAAIFARHNRRFSTLYMDYTKVTDTGAAEFAHSAAIQSVSFWGDHLTDAVPEALAKSDSSALRSLELNENPITDFGAAALANTSYLTEVSLNNTKITDLGAVLLSRSNGTLYTLDLASDGITDRGAEALAKSATLKELFLADNRITDAGAISLAKDLSLTGLDASCNYIGADGLSALFKHAGWKFLSVAHQHTASINNLMFQGINPKNKNLHFRSTRLR